MSQTFQNKCHDMCWIDKYHILSSYLCWNFGAIINLFWHTVSTWVFVN